MDFSLNVQKREAVGRKVRALRRAGLFPMVVYGYKIDALPIQTSQKEFVKIFKDAGENSIINVKVEGDNSEMDVVIHDVAFDSLHNPIHADLYKVQQDKEITSEIPLEFIGESKAVKEMKCILIKKIESIEVRCLPKHLPHVLTVNLEELDNAGDVIRIDSIKVAKEVQIINDSNDVVAMAEEPKMKEDKEDNKDVSAEEKKDGDEKDAPASNALPARQPDSSHGDRRSNAGRENNEEKQTAK